MTISLAKQGEKERRINLLIYHQCKGFTERKKTNSKTSSKKGKQEVRFDVVTSSRSLEAFTAIPPSIANNVEGNNAQYTEES